jgi:hypothetical protein
MKIVHPKAGHLDFEELRTFICQGKKNGWASGAHPVNLSNGNKNYTFRMGDLLYTDNYIGEQGFMGMELVKFKGVPIWGMHYSGILTFPDSQKSELNRLYFEGQVNSFLAEMLRKVPNNLPFRGPVGVEVKRQTAVGELAYENVAIVCPEIQMDGTIRKFIGREHISFRPSEQVKASEVFELDYHGRLLISDACIQR